MCKTLRLLLVFSIALAIRLTPYVLTQMPFSIDAWPLIKDVHVLLKSMPIPLSSREFDGYNNYWPGSILADAVVVVVMGDRPSCISQAVHAVASSVAVLMICSAVLRLTRSEYAAVLSGIAASAVFPYSLMMSGVVKESYASPLVAALLYTVLTRRGSKTAAVIVPALVITHHLSSLVTLVAVAGCLILLAYENLERGTRIERSLIYLFIYLLMVTLVYNVGYALRHYPAIRLTEYDVTSLVSYLLVMETLAYLLLSSKAATGSGRAVLYITLVSMISLLALCLAVTTLPLLPGIPPLPRSYLPLTAPFAAIAVLLSLAYRENLAQKPLWYVLASSWLSAILAFAAYATFSGTYSGATLAYRSINFIELASLPLIGAGFAAARTLARRSAHMLSAILLAAIVIPSLYAYSLAVTMRSGALGSIWVNRRSEHAMYKWLNVYVAKASIGGDEKTRLAMYWIYGLNVSVERGYAYVKGASCTGLLVYPDYWNWLGFFAGPYSISIDKNRLALLQYLNKYYENGHMALLGARGWK